MIFEIMVLLIFILLFLLYYNNYFFEYYDNINNQPQIVDVDTYKNLC